MSKIATKKYFPGNIIIHEGDFVDVAYVINYGYAEVYKRLSETEVVTITKLGTGQIFGEMSLFGDKKSSASVKALTEMEVQIISKKVFEEYLEQTPPLIKILLEILSHRLVHTSQKYILAQSDEAKCRKFLKIHSKTRVDFNDGKIKE